MGGHVLGVCLTSLGCVVAVYEVLVLAEGHLLNLIDIYKLEPSKFMFGLHNNCLPKIFNDSLTKLELVHCHNTRQLTTYDYF